MLWRFVVAYTSARHEFLERVSVTSGVEAMGAFVAAALISGVFSLGSIGSGSRLMAMCQSSSYQYTSENVADPSIGIYKQHRIAVFSAKSQGIALTIQCLAVRFRFE